MKRTVYVFLCVAMLFVSTALVTAETEVLSEGFSRTMSSTGSYGDWSILGNRLVQKDTRERLAKINFAADQTGLMQYSFEVSYVDGGLIDRMGGFGIQVFVDKAFNGKSWGNGNSYLLWLNYDEVPTYGEPGFRAQVYRSYGLTRMEIIEGCDIMLDPAILAVKDMKITIPVTIQVNGDTGLIKVLDFSGTGSLVEFYLEAPSRGRYISLRTNSLSLSFDNLKVTKLD